MMNTFTYRNVRGNTRCEAYRAISSEDELDGEEGVFLGAERTSSVHRQISASRVVRVSRLV